MLLGRRIVTRYQAADMPVGVVQALFAKLRPRLAAKDGFAGAQDEKPATQLDVQRTEIDNPLADVAVLSDELGGKGIVAQAGQIVRSAESGLGASFHARIATCGRGISPNRNFLAKKGLRA